MTQSIRNTVFESKVLHSPSISQLTDTFEPHQKVSKKQVVSINDPVKAVTP